MEMDYRLVENEGLFQEYLEMGKLARFKHESILTIHLNVTAYRENSLSILKWVASSFETIIFFKVF